jgi:hypothetical protein
MIGILYHEGVRPLLITVVGCAMNGDSPAFGCGAEQRMVEPPPSVSGIVLIRATVVQTQRDWSLRHRNDEVRPFLLTLCVSGLKRDRATSSDSLLCSWSMASSPGEALVLSSLPTMVEAAREVFPGLGWAQGMAKQRLGLDLCGKNSKGTSHYLWGFLHRIIAEEKF